ncbi:MAG TPA: hypothetical protein VHU23_06745 [Rhizomicrobium sp.]|jgi:hypothetical protein|nr:hypothetical protein [Rhizomicrobium sp.]
MNKFLLMSAAAVLSTTSASFAATHHDPSSGSTSFYSTTGGGGAYCNQWYATWNGAAYGNQDNLEVHCYYSGIYSNGVGFAGKVKKMGNVIQLPASIAMAEGVPSYASNFVIGGKKIKAGASIVGWGTDPSLSVYEFSAGGVALGQAPRAPKGKVMPNVQRALLGYAAKHVSK